MSDDEIVQAESGGKVIRVSLNWETRRWTSEIEPDLADFPFIAEVRGKRYELYDDQTFDEEELTPEEERAVGP